MEAIRSVIWNSDQRRLRTAWRLTVQLLLLLVIATVIEIPIGIVAAGMLVTQEGVTLDRLTDTESMQVFILDNTVPIMLSSIGLALAFAISIWLAGRLLDRRPFADFGFHLSRDWWIDFGFGLVLGALLMLIIFLIELAAGWVTVTGTFVTRGPDSRFLPTILPPLVIFVTVGFYEELFSRGYQLQNLAEGLTWNVIGPRAAILIATLVSSATFGVLHALNPEASARSTLQLILAGVQLATGYVLTGELAIPIALHITWNFFQGNVFGFPVSGTHFRSATFISIEQGGPDLWTGGSFGPEAGLIGLGVMILGILLTVLWVGRRYGRAQLDLSLAEPPQHPDDARTRAGSTQI